jgi:D-alanine-D-alanine ligase
VTIIYNYPARFKKRSRSEEAAVVAVMESVIAVKKSLESLGHEVVLLGLKEPFEAAAGAVRACKTDLFFNLFEGLVDDSDSEWRMVEVLEEMGLPFTGASRWTLALCLDKAKTKMRLRSLGLPTADYQVMENPVVKFKLSFPAMVKPCREDASQGCDFSSVVYNGEELQRQVESVIQNYSQPALAEVFLPGREFNATILGGSNPRVLAPSEIVFAEDYPGPRILTYASKWRPNDPAYQKAMAVCPAPVEEPMLQEIESLALLAHQTVGSPDYARVDLRTDAEGRLHLLEVNPNPDLSPSAGMALQSRTCGMSYSDLVGQIVGLALEGARIGRRDAAAHAS